MVLFLHNRYRTTGGEERVVQSLLALVRDRLGEPAALLARESAGLPRTRAALGLLRGGLGPEEVARAVRADGARVVHAHNPHPTLGWRALAAARAQGARVVLHLHQYRLVCAVGVCFTQGRECTRCHGRNTLPGIVRNCRGSLPEALTYGAGLALWQRRLVAQADALVVPSAFAAARLRELGAPLEGLPVHVIAPPLASTIAERAPRHPGDGYALAVSRLSVEKGLDVAIEACRRAGMGLVIAGDGPERTRLEGLAAGADVRFAGHVDDVELARLRAGAAVAVVPSRSAETFGMAAAEAMACGLPAAGSRIGALADLIEEEGLARPGDAGDLAVALARVRADPQAPERALARVRSICSPEAIARALACVYDGRAPA